MASATTGLLDMRDQMDAVVIAIQVTQHQRVDANACRLSQKIKTA